MRKFLHFLNTMLLALLPAASLFTAAPAQAATVTAGLIKGPGDAVYWYSTDGKRYVFPTYKTFASWYGDKLPGIQQLTLEQLGAIPLGGNVTYKPGVRMVKVTTDPKVYAVSHYGVLRWIANEQLAAQLYGADWAKKIDDLPDPFFVNYRVGSNVNVASDFSPSASGSFVATPDDVRQVTVSIDYTRYGSTPVTLEQGKLMLYPSGDCALAKCGYDFKAKAYTAQGGGAFYTLIQDGVLAFWGNNTGQGGTVRLANGEAAFPLAASGQYNSQAVPIVNGGWYAVYDVANQQYLKFHVTDVNPPLKVTVAAEYTLYGDYPAVAEQGKLVLHPNDCVLSRCGYDFKAKDHTAQGGGAFYTLFQDGVLAFWGNNTGQGGAVRLADGNAVLPGATSGQYSSQAVQIVEGGWYAIYDSANRQYVKLHVTNVIVP